MSLLPEYHIKYKSEDEAITCKYCEWSGLRKQTVSEWEDSLDEAPLSGWQGWVYHCPTCGWLIDTEIHIQS